MTTTLTRTGASNGHAAPAGQDPGVQTATPLPPIHPPASAPAKVTRNDVRSAVRLALGVLLVLVGLVAGFAAFVSGGRNEALQQKGFDRWKIGSLLINDGTITESEAWPADLPVALVRIPRYDRSLAVFAGVGKEQLRRGPGYDPNTARPGFAGNTVMIGKSGTYGSAFADLDQLVTGDQLIMTTVGGTLAYSVLEVKIADKNDPFVYEQTDGAWLTLVGHDGNPLSSDRAIVRAEAIAGMVDGNVFGPEIPPSTNDGFAPIVVLGMIALAVAVVMAGELILVNYLPVAAARWIAFPIVAAITLPLIEQILLLLPRTW